jgi:hypothetical protein
MATASQLFIEEISFTGSKFSKANATAGPRYAVRRNVLNGSGLMESPLTGCWGKTRGESLTGAAED